MSAKDRVLLMKEARRRAEEDATRARLAAAALDSVAERKKAQYLTREQYRGVNAVIAGMLPINSKVLEESVADTAALVSALSAQLPGSRYGDDSKDGADDETDHKTSHNEDDDVDVTDRKLEESELGIGGDAAADADDSLTEGRTRGGRRYVDGELPEDDDSEDEVLLEMAQDSGSEDEPGSYDPDARPAVSASASVSAAPSAGKANAGSGRGVNGELGNTTSHHISLDTGSEDEEDIGEVEKQLRHELMRSTMRCNDLRQSLDVARKIAVSAGVPMQAPGSARRISSASTPNGEGKRFAFQPDDRPIKPAAHAISGLSGNGGALPPTSGAAAASSSASGPSPRSVLAPSAAATAAAGGYLKASSADGSSSSARPSIAADGIASRNAAAFDYRRNESRRVSAGAVVGSGADDEEDEDADESAEDADNDETDAIEENNEEEELLEDDEEDIGDEDGDEEGGVSFAPRSARGRDGRDKIGPGTIREVDDEEDDEDEDEDEEEDESDSMYGSGHGIASEFKTRLGLQGDGGGYSGTSTGTGSGTGANRYGANSTTSSGGGAIGPLSSRVEDLRRQCIVALGEELFDAAYCAVKKALWGDEGEDGEDGEGSGNGSGSGNENADEDLSTLPERLDMSEEQASYVDTIISLVHMEHDLL